MLGQEGEDIAVGYLKKNGYRIVQKNFRTSIGEIDIIAKERDTLVFVEVKTRESLKYGQPFESVTKFKRLKIAKVALLYLKKLHDIPACRFDIVSIHHKKGKPEIDLIKDAFEVLL